MNNQGFALTIEAILALLVVAAMVSFPLQEEKPGLFELHLLQKENDLLKVWVSEKELDESQLVSDFNFVFPLKNGSIQIGEKSIEIRNNEAAASDSISSSALFLSRDAKLIELRITVYS